MNQSINTGSKNSKEPQQKYRLGNFSIKILGGLNRFYGRPTSPSASIMAQNIQLFKPNCNCRRKRMQEKEPIMVVWCKLKVLSLRITAQDNCLASFGKPRDAE